MKKTAKNLRAYEQILNARNIHRPVKKSKTLIKKFLSRTNQTALIGDVINTTLLLTAIRQAAWEKQKDAGG